MSSQSNKNIGGTSGRAVSGMRNGRDAARAGERMMLARGLALIAASFSLLVLIAPELWPHLFAH